jgi:membrane-associated HD superfamily phosphohydrolase
MSASLIKRHVAEGLEMATEYKLPRLVADAIPQHHGTRWWVFTGPIGGKRRRRAR